jgi:hypothetical protein
MEMQQSQNTIQNNIAQSGLAMDQGRYGMDLTSFNQEQSALNNLPTQPTNTGLLDRISQGYQDGGFLGAITGALNKPEPNAALSSLTDAEMAQYTQALNSGNNLGAQQILSIANQRASDVLYQQQVNPNLSAQANVPSAGSSQVRSILADTQSNRADKVKYLTEIGYSAQQADQEVFNAERSIFLQNAFQNGVEMATADSANRGISPDPSWVQAAQEYENTVNSNTRPGFFSEFAQNLYNMTPVSTPINMASKQAGKLWDKFMR